MPRKGHTNEQIIYALQQVEGGQRVADVCREIGVSEATFYAWRNTADAEGASIPHAVSYREPSVPQGACRFESGPLESLIQAGVTREFLASVVREGLQATEVKLAQYEGHFTDRAEVPDYKARFKFAELGYRLHGDLTHEEVTQQAALVIQIGSRELVAGHGPSCRCQECEEAWEKLAVQTASADER